MRILIFVISIHLIIGCKNTSPEQIAETWTDNIKNKILQDSNYNPDSVYYDSTATFLNLTFYHSGAVTKKFHISTSGDTAVSIFYSPEGNFSLVRENCPVVSRSFEGIRYNGNFFGLATLRYCNGKLKEKGFRYDEKEIGLWLEYDSTGKITEKKDYGNSSVLAKLPAMSYR